MIPGCFSPTEFFEAQKMGCKIQKLFPATGTGPTWIRQMRGPLPDLNIVPVNDVGYENMTEWLDAGFFGLGMADELFKAQDMEKGNF